MEPLVLFSKPRAVKTSTLQAVAPPAPNEVGRRGRKGEPGLAIERQQTHKQSQWKLSGSIFKSAVIRLRWNNNHSPTQPSTILRSVRTASASAALSPLCLARYAIPTCIQAKAPLPKSWVTASDALTSCRVVDARTSASRGSGSTNDGTRLEFESTSAAVATPTTSSASSDSPSCSGEVYSNDFKTVNPRWSRLSKDFAMVHINEDGAWKIVTNLSTSALNVVALGNLNVIPDTARYLCLNLSPGGPVVGTPHASLNANLAHMTVSIFTFKIFSGDRAPEIAQCLLFASPGLFVCLIVCLFVSVFVCLSECLFVCLFCLSLFIDCFPSFLLVSFFFFFFVCVCLFVCLRLCLFVCLFVCYFFVRVCVCLFVGLLSLIVVLYVCLCVCLCIVCLIVCMFVYLLGWLFVCLFVVDCWLLFVVCCLLLTN